MPTHRVIRMATAFVTAAGLAAALGALPHASSKDTVNDVVKAGREGGAAATRLQADLSARAASEKDPKARAQIADRLEVLARIRPFLARLARDQAFAKQVLDLAQRNDTPALTGLLRREGGSSGQIVAVADFSLKGTFTLNGTTYDVCVYSDITQMILPHGCHWDGSAISVTPAQ
jgi:hypothetical protein